MVWDSGTIRSVVRDMPFPGLVWADRTMPGEMSDLHAEEVVFVSQAVLSRQLEFAAGRACAREALKSFGFHQFQLRMAETRAPIWPESIVGSITHTEGYCAAVVGRRSQFASIGIDAEIIGKVEHSVWGLVFTDKEIVFLANMTMAEQAIMSTLLFSAKEAFFKCQHFLTNTWLDFLEVEIDIFPRRFSVSAPKLECMPISFEGFFCTSSSLNRVTTLVTAALSNKKIRTYAKSSTYLPR